MSTKKEGVRRSTNAIKILNDEQISPMPLPVMTTVPLAPTKLISMSIAKTKTPSPKKKLKQMDHYVLQTIKGESTEEGLEGEIDFVLTENNETEQSDGIAGPSGEITEELHVNGDDVEGEEKTEEIVEHVCGKCYKSFRRFSGLKKHLDFCRFDSGYHLRKAEMLKNLEKIEKDAINMENKDICFCCGESYDTFHLGHINCPDCPKSFKSQMSYERHIFITHSEFNDFPCDICNAKLRSANLLNLHVEQHKSRGKPFACKICGRDFTRSYHLKRHQKYSSCSANESDSMNCKVCNKTFYRLDNLRSHLKQHLGTHVTKKPEYMCPVCKNCFYSLSTLNIHARTHTGERPFDCDLCDKKFPSLVALKKHRRYHTGEKPYTCSVCNQSFAVKEVLNRHMKRHTGERPHVCSECGKSFIQATQLRCHAGTHVRPYECEHCDEKFKTEKQLGRHEKIHFRKPRRKSPIKCDICKEVFTDAEQLQQHMETGEHVIKKNPEKKRKVPKEITYCSICEKNFDTNKSLQFHILKVHEVDPLEVAIKPDDNDDDDSVPLSKYRKIHKTEIENANNEAQNKDKDDNIISLDVEESVETSSSGVVVKEFIVDEVESIEKETIVLRNQAYTIIPLESVGNIIDPVTTQHVQSATELEKEAASVITPSAAMLDINKSAENTKKSIRKSLRKSIAAAMCAEEEINLSDIEMYNEEDLKLKENVGKLLDMLVDKTTLRKFGWPKATEENVLCKVIENCGHDLSKDANEYEGCDYATRMREYVKLLFTVVIHNDSIKELLNNYPIDEVIEYVLGNEEDADDDNEDRKDD